MWVSFNNDHQLNDQTDYVDRQPALTGIPGLPQGKWHYKSSCPHMTWGQGGQEDI